METNNVKKTRYSESELQEFKRLILAKREKNQDDYELYTEMAREGSGANKERNEEVAQTKLKFIKDHLDPALARIATNTYGFDRETGELIPKPRLIAVPWATTSCDTKEKEKMKPLLAPAMR